MVSLSKVGHDFGLRGQYQSIGNALNVLSLRCALVLMLNASILLSSNSAIAAEQVVLNYRSFGINFREELSNC